MIFAEALRQAVTSIGVVLVALAAVTLLETLIPLRARETWGRAHVAVNLTLTLITFVTNAFLNSGLVLLVFWLQSRELGLLRWLPLHPLAAAVLAVSLLDLSFYAAHVSWHKIPSLWRFHAVHHSDAHMNVTTTIRQHPVEGLMRYGVLAVAVIVLGPSPAAFTVYRLASVLNALPEHANLRAPRWLDEALSLVTTWPHMHKVHHSRVPAQTDSNYGNLFSFWDRLFGTFTPSHHGREISYGLDGFDDPRTQTLRSLLAHPFRGGAATNTRSQVLDLVARDLDVDAPRHPRA